jgi:hypothetical protein
MLCSHHFIFYIIRNKTATTHKLYVHCNVHFVLGLYTSQVEPIYFRSCSSLGEPKKQKQKKTKKTLTFTGKYGGTRQELEKLNSRVRRSQSPTHRDSRHRRYWWYTSKTRIFFLFYFRKYYYRPEFEATCVQVWTPTRLFYHTQNSCCITYKAKY